MLFSEHFVNRPIMAISINLVLLIMGLVAFNQLELRHQPKVVHNEVQVVTTYPGANSEAVEHQVTKPLEDALSGLEGIKKLTSNTQDGRSEITVKFKSGIDNKKALAEVRDRVLAASNTLPEAVKRPLIQEQGEGGQSILYLSFKDDTRSTPALTDYVRRVVEDRLRLVDGVASLERFGDELYIVAIKPDPALLAEHQITVHDIITVLKREKAFASGGEVEGVTGKETVVLTTQVENPEDFSKITVKMRPNERITIGDVATVSISKKTTMARLRVDGQAAVSLGIMVKPSANPLEVVKRVNAFLIDLKKSLPPSLVAEIHYDATKPFKAAFAEIRHTLWEAIILVAIIVTLSLGSFRAALLPMITVPLCLVGTFIFMWQFGFTLNPVTLLALVLAVGLVVDDAIVVVENIHRHMESGLSALQAARQSMKEITFAVIVMTITLAAVYMPLVFQLDDSAVIFREFAWTLAGSVIISGFVALTLTPALCGKFLTKPKHLIVWEKLSLMYREKLSIALQHPRKICVFLVLVAFLGVVGFQRLPSEFTPTEDEDMVFGSMNVENAVPANLRESWFKEVEAVFKTIPEYDHALTGMWQEQWMWWNLLLKPRAERNRGSAAIAEELRKKFKAVTGPDIFVVDNASMGEEPLKIILQYTGNQSRLIKAVNDIKAEAKKNPGFSGFTSEEAFEKIRLSVKVDRALAAELGVGLDAIEDTLYTFLAGKKVADYNFQGFDYDVEVRAPEKYRSELDSLNTYFVSSAEGQWVPLGSLVSVKEVLEPNQIKHYERRRGVSITANLTPEMPLDKAMQVLEPIVKKHLPPDAQFRFAGKAEQYQEAQQAMWLTFALSLAFIYLVLAALFESFVHPFVVLLTVPLSIIGSVVLVTIMGGTSNVYTAIGLITLIGLITKHGILIVDFSNRLRETTKTLNEAVIEAAVSRLRPVLMTTLAMICGALPLVFSVGAGAMARKHIGWVIIGGMLTGTVFSLFVIPVVYSIVEKRSRKK